MNPVCPPTSIGGRVALVTGGSRGIGLETSRGLAARGAEVISAARAEGVGKRVAEDLRGEYGQPAHFLTLDLADLGSLPGTLDRLESLLGGRRLDIVVANAGLWPDRYGVSAQGHEIAFATNVLGHHALIRNSLERGLLAEGARVVIVTGDIYIMSAECSSDYTYRSPLGGQLAYCRSKLGNLWYAQELARRYPSLRVHAVHPGVAASELAGANTGASGAFKRAFMLSPEEGAQTSLFCATEPDLESGTYFHNTLGRVELRSDDPGSDTIRAQSLWDRVEELSREAGV